MVEQVLAVKLTDTDKMRLDSVIMSVSLFGLTTDTQLGILRDGASSTMLSQSPIIEDE